MEMETAVVVVGVDVGHGWLCLDLVGRMVRGGDGEPWLRLRIYF
jgi:hypothetical protein